MKNFATILVAIVLFSLCLIEKKLKERAIENQIATESLSLERDTIKERPVANATSVVSLHSNNQYATLNLQRGNLAVGDSVFNGSTSTLEKPL